MIHQFPLYNVTICDFCVLLRSITPTYSRMIDTYHINSFNRDAKRLLTHCIIQACCDTALGISHGKIVFYYNRECMIDSNIVSSEIAEFIHKLIQECTKKLPITWYCSSKPLSYYLDIIKKHQGNSFLFEISNKNKAKYTFDRAIKYITQHKLTFLNDQYFNSLKTRCLLLNT